MRKWCAILLAAVVVVCLSAEAADFWTKKNYKQWTLKECEKLLRDSPWAKEYTLSEVYITPLEPPSIGGPAGPIGSEPSERAREENPRLVYRVQLRSALPIRQALVRTAQLSQGYDSMTPEQRQALDQRAEAFLGQQYSDFVVVYVSFQSNLIPDSRELVRYWASQTTDTLKNSVFLIGGEGVKAPLQSFVKGEADAQLFQFVFPRQVNGRPLVSAADKRLQLEFIHPSIRNQREKRVLVEFKVKKMLVNGQPVY